MPKIFVSDASASFHRPLSWDHFRAQPLPETPSKVDFASVQPEVTSVDTHFEAAQPSAHPAVALLSYTKGLGTGALIGAKNAATEQVSLVEALFYRASNHITDGAAEELANAPYGPEHLRRAKANSDAIGQLVREHVHTAKKTLKNAFNPSALGISLSHMYLKFTVGAAKGALTTLTDKIEQIKTLEQPWAKLSAKINAARTEDDWFIAGKDASLFTVATLGTVLFNGRKLVSPVILPSGTKIPTETYVINKETWPKRDHQSVVYRDPENPKKVYKHIQPEVGRLSPTEKDLSIDERIRVAQGLPKYQNAFGRVAQRAVGEQAIHRRVHWEGGPWTSQLYIPYMDPSFKALSPEQQQFFNAVRNQMDEAVTQYTIRKYSGRDHSLRQIRGNMMFVDNGLTIWVDRTPKNFRLDMDRSTLYWFDNAVVLPERIIHPNMFFSGE